MTVPMMSCCAPRALFATPPSMMTVTVLEIAKTGIFKFVLGIAFEVFEIEL